MHSCSIPTHAHTHTYRAFLHICLQSCCLILHLGMFTSLQIARKRHKVINTFKSPLGQTRPPPPLKHIALMPLSQIRRVLDLQDTEGNAAATCTHWKRMKLLLTTLSPCHLKVFYIIVCQPALKCNTHNWFNTLLECLCYSAQCLKRWQTDSKKSASFLFFLFFPVHLRMHWDLSQLLDIISFKWCVFG